MSLQVPDAVHLFGKEAELYQWNRPSPSKIYYETWFPYNLVRDWCGASWQGDQEYSLQQGETIVDRHYRALSSGEMRSAVSRNDVTRIDVGPRVDTQGRTVFQHLAFDLDSDLYTDVYPGQGETVDESGLITTPAWIMLNLSLGYLGLYLATQLHLGWQENGEKLDARSAFQYVFSGRRGAHLWVPNAHRDWITHKDVQELSSHWLPTLRTANGVYTMHRTLCTSGKQVDAWLNRVEMYARNALVSPYLWERATDSTEHDELARVLLPHLSALCREHVQPNAEYFRNHLDEWSSETWQRLGLLLIAPRHDRNVTTASNHLLKAPFSLHSTTHLVALPYDPFLEENGVRDNVCLHVNELIHNTNATRPYFDRAIERFNTVFDYGQQHGLLHTRPDSA
jgi:hypothetical protein